MNRTNFEAIIRTERKREQAAYEEFISKSGKKLNKTKRGVSTKRDWKETI